MFDPKDFSPALSALWAYLQFELTYISMRDKNVYFLSLSRRRGQVCLCSMLVLREIQERCPSPNPSYGQQASGNMNSLGAGGLYYVFVCHCISNGNE